MELKSFGSILSFAAELQSANVLFYQEAAQNPDCISHKETLDALIKDHKQIEQRVLKTRRENVTEMILEPINGFSSDTFVIGVKDTKGLKLAEIIEKAKSTEKLLGEFYLTAADKIKALPEVAMEMKIIAKKYSAHVEKLIDL